MGLELRADSGNIYLHAQVFTGLMYVAAAVCMWFLRAWKIREVERVEEQQRSDNREPGGVVGDGLNALSRNDSNLVCVKSKVNAGKGLFVWGKV